MKVHERIDEGGGATHAAGNDVRGATDELGHAARRVLDRMHVLSCFSGARMLVDLNYNGVRNSTFQNQSPDTRPRAAVRSCPYTQSRHENEMDWLLSNQRRTCERPHPPPSD